MLPLVLLHPSRSAPRCVLPLLLFAALDPLSVVTFAATSRQVTAAELVAAPAVAQMAGVRGAEIPCNTVSRLDPSNQRPGYTIHREYSTMEADIHCALRSVVVVGGTRDERERLQFI